MIFYEIFVPNRFSAENVFRTYSSQEVPLPTFSKSRDLLPSPFWAGKEDVIECYWKTWEIGFGNLRIPPQGSPLISNFIDTAFNGATFMWDSAFMSMFGCYGNRAFNFQGTLDNFYGRQREDGYICREILVKDGSECFERHDPSSTGPNILPWAEWEYYLKFGDKERLSKVFPALVAFGQWFKKYRSWPDGTYFSSGLGCGMDNQPRLPDGLDERFDHGHMSWVDTTIQQILSDRLLLEMAEELGRTEEIADLREEAPALCRFVNQYLWDEREGFYFDRWRDGKLSSVKTVGAYWALLAGIVPMERMERFLDHLKNPREFNRPHRIPSLSADHPAYDRQTGNYWLGGVWAPTNYMVLRGLSHVHADSFAHEIAVNHLLNVVRTFNNTGTLWENYAPELPSQGNPAKPDFVGWTGLSPIAILLEYVLGLRADATHRKLLWDVRLLEAHGVTAYPIGSDMVVDLQCDARHSINDEPLIKADTNQPLTLIVRWACGEKTLDIRPL